MNIAFFSTKSFDKCFFDASNQQFSFNITYFEASLSYQTIPACKGFDGVCVFVNDCLDEKCIEALATLNIKFIALRSAGFNHVDINACQNHHIKVVRVPEYSSYAVAEHAMALLLTINRKTHKAYHRVREGNFSLEGLMGFNLYQKTIGLIGLGKIGKRFASICHGFGLEVLAYDNEPDMEFTKKFPVQFVEFDELLNQADIISLHCPLTVSTRHMINKESIIKMKKNVVIINTSRGGLIDSHALIDGLKEKKIAAVGLDVYEQESNVFFEDHSEDIIDDDILMRLTTFPNVLITSHQGFFTKEALIEIASVTLSNIKSLEEGSHCSNEVTSY